MHRLHHVRDSVATLPFSLPLSQVFTNIHNIPYVYTSYGVYEFPLRDVIHHSTVGGCPYIWRRRLAPLKHAINEQLRNKRISTSTSNFSYYSHISHDLSTNRLMSFCRNVIEANPLPCARRQLADSEDARCAHRSGATRCATYLE